MLLKVVLALGKSTRLVHADSGTFAHLAVLAVLTTLALLIVAVPTMSASSQPSQAPFEGFATDSVNTSTGALLGHSTTQTTQSQPHQPVETQLQEPMKTDATCAPGGQCFADVLSSNPFYASVNLLYQHDVISGYTCGGPGEPCDTYSRPYYRPLNNVNRQQMAKFVDNGRRNIDIAIGQQLSLTNTVAPGLTISTTSTDGLRVLIAAGADGVDTDCTRANMNCFALEASAVTGNRTGYLTGGRGAFIQSADNTYPGAEIASSGNTAYGGNIRASNYRAAHIQGADGWNDLVVDGTVTVGEFNGAVQINGNLTVTGSKSGYVVDVMQNGDGTPLEAGDVVVVVGNSPAVIGDIPVVVVKRASQAYDTSVVGVVDQVLYVPDAATRAQYLAEQKATREALARRAIAEAEAAAQGDGARPTDVDIPAQTISDDMGNIHADTAATHANTAAYINVVTLGSYKAVKVDASFGAVKTGDLLTTSPNPGYAMKVTDKAEANGAIIGKALGNLDSGIGVVPVMVTLK
jgi:hypothetical protein